MFLRKITQEVPYPRPPEEAFRDARQTLLFVGKVKSADEASGTLKGSIPGGGWVTLEVRVSPAGDGSLLSLAARCDDVWGAGARRGLGLFLQGLPRQERDRTPGAPAAPVPRKVPNLEADLSLTQKVRVAVFLLLASLGSL